MTKQEYLERALKLLNEGKINEEVYDSMIMNVDNFAFEEEDEE